MRSRQLDLEQYRTDKVRNGYLPWYDDVVGERYAEVRNVLELGVQGGGSLELWRDYFPQAQIAGVDSDLTKFSCSDRTRIEVFQGSQTDTQFLSAIAKKSAPEGFDVIIDDASHYGVKSEVSFECLFRDHLKPGGIYVIEDWGTGYLSDWPDGRRRKHPFRVTRAWLLLTAILRKCGIALPVRSHSYGMVGMVKRLVDQLGTQGNIDEIFMTVGIAAILKSAPKT